MGTLVKMADTVLNLDIHLEQVPGPVPVLPFPNPFMGHVYDEGLLVSEVLGDSPIVAVLCMALDPVGSAVNAVFDEIEGVHTGAVKVGEHHAANVQNKASSKLPAGIPHMVIPPGTKFVSDPDDDATMEMGSTTVKLRHHSAVRDDDIVKSCSDPTRSPMAHIISGGGGNPVLVGGSAGSSTSSNVDGMIRGLAISIGHAALRHATPSRARNAQSTDHCHSAGEPVDVATGRMFWSAIDWELPGPIPLVFKRLYSSVVSDRDSAVGFGWSHSLDQAVWPERGRVVYRAEDGREIEFDTFHLPGHIARPRDTIFNPRDRLTLRCLSELGWEIETQDGLISEFVRVRGDRSPLNARLVRIRQGEFDIRLAYDAEARLEWVRDSSGRQIHFAHDSQGHLTSVALPKPQEPGLEIHTRYSYDADGNLIAVVDPLGNVSRYACLGHLVVQRTDRAGLSFHYGYDGIGASSWCVRTWGDGGIYDHVLEYDKKKRLTIDVNSLGYGTIYQMGESYEVLTITDALGGVTAFEYDSALRMTKETDAIGNATQWEYDTRGNCTKTTKPDGATESVTYDEYARPIQLIDSMRNTWTRTYDAAGRVIGLEGPLSRSVRFGYANGLLVWMEAEAGARTVVEYDAQNCIGRATGPTGAQTEYGRDALGRLVWVRDERGGVHRYVHDQCGRIVREEGTQGWVRERRYDGEGNTVEEVDSGGARRFAHSGFHKVALLEEAGTSVRYEYDTEDQLVAIVNEGGERYEYRLDALGNVLDETSFDGRKSRYERDQVGRAIEISSTDGTVSKVAHDQAGRITRVEHEDGTFKRFAYRPDGEIIEATNQHLEVRFERDAIGRVEREWQGHDWIVSTWGRAGERVAIESSRGAHQVIVRDAIGVVEEVQFGRDRSGRKVGFSRDASGLEVARHIPGGVSIQWQRDSHGRPENRRILRGDHELGAQGFRWSEADQLTALLDSNRGPTFYEHEPRGGLIGARSGAGVEDIRAMDTVGNVYRRRDGNDRTYGAGGRIETADGISYQYSDDQRLLKRVMPDGAQWHYDWSQDGLLRSVERPDGSKIVFVYDAFGRRIEKKFGEQTVRWIWDGDVVLHEIRGDQDPVTWVWEPETFAPLAKMEAGRAYAIATDVIGTPTDLFDDDGRVVWKALFDIWGTPEISTDHIDCPWGFPGQQIDTETGLHYNRFRYYDPRTGTYLSPDPIGPAGGLRLYGYVSDPLIFCDPFGLSSCRGGQTRPEIPHGNPKVGWKHIFSRHVPGFSSNQGDTFRVRPGQSQEQIERQIGRGIDQTWHSGTRMTADPASINQRFEKRLTINGLSANYRLIVDTVGNRVVTFFPVGR